jgi:hypothetical protein
VLQVERTNDSGNYEAVVTKDARTQVESVNKLADRAATYRFCVMNRGEEMIKMGIRIMTGLELANLDYLPSYDDQENLHR